MPEKRYHIHLICSPDDQVAMLDKLAIFMERKAFLTHDLMQSDNESSNYSRRCIDNCDYLIMVVGDSYGRLSQTGVSQVHLSYIYAKTKSKPILIFLKLHNDTDNLSRQLKDLIEVIENQNSGSIYYYDDDINVQEFLEPVYRKFIRENKQPGWKKLTLKSYKNKQEKPTESPILPKQKKIDAVDLNFKIMINFTTHAYKEGNLKNVSLMAPLTWKQVLELIDKSMYVLAFQRAINDLINDKALKIAQNSISINIHAVAQTKVSKADIKWMISQMVQFNWITVVTPDSNNNNSKNVKSKNSQEIIEITDIGKQKLSS